MTDDQQEKALRIAAYIQNRLSPEEREAFKRALGEDDDLRVQYVDALMNRAGTDTTGTEKTEAPVPETIEQQESGPAIEERETSVSQDAKETFVGEEASEVLVGQGEGESWEAAPQEVPEKARGRFLGSGWMVGLTVLLLLVAAAVIFLWMRHQAFWDTTVATITKDSGKVNKGNKLDSSAANGQVAAPVSGVDSTKPAAGTGARSSNAGWADGIYSKLYKPYMRGDDPAAVRQYYQEYKKGNFAAVLAADDSVVVKGTSLQRVQLRDYMRLYKGLSYLATGDGQSAVAQLGGVVIRTKPGDDLYDAARWYLALAWLRRSDVDTTEAKSKAVGLARDISGGYSRYRESAAELLRKFSN
jgi:hypothetical protein